MGIRKTIKNLLGFKSDFASLTVVGVGPGDSSLLTIAAVEAIKTVSYTHLTLPTKA